MPQNDVTRISATMGVRVKDKILLHLVVFCLGLTRIKLAKLELPRKETESESSLYPFYFLVSSFEKQLRKICKAMNKPFKASEQSIFRE